MVNDRTPKPEPSAQDKALLGEEVLERLKETPLGDDILIAFADGELSASLCTEISNRIATEQQTRARYEALGRTGPLAQEALTQATAQLPAEKLVDAVRKLTPAQAQAQAQAPEREGTSLWETLWARLKRLSQENLLTTAPLPAWSLALCVLFGAGFLIGRITEGPGTGELTQVAQLSLGPLSAQSDLALALETTPSTQPQQLEDGTLTILVSFQDLDGHFCREFDLVSEAETRDLVVGVACRKPAGTWNIEFSSESHGLAGTEAGLFAPASDRIHEAASSYVEARMAGDPLSAATEAAAIEAGWNNDGN